jgi:23S rRNA G2445 N2-methylase RlmL
LAGAPLYKRGYRQALSASAPLREDAAFCCMRNALQYAKQIDKNYLPETLLIPFSGTGTFSFEYLLSRFNFSSVLFERHYALCDLPFFNEENFNFLLKKAREAVSPVDPDVDFICIDHSENAMSAFLENMKNVQDTFIKQNVSFSEDMFFYKTDDFFRIDLDKMIAGKNIFMPMNPPYGIRIGKNNNSEELYKKIAKRVNELMEITRKSGKKLLGFILCPDEKTWSHFCNTLHNMKTNTYHFTQGGLDIRVCQFFC